MAPHSLQDEAAESREVTIYDSQPNPERMHKDPSPTPARRTTFAPEAEVWLPPESQPVSFAHALSAKWNGYTGVISEHYMVQH